MSVQSGSTPSGTKKTKNIDDTTTNLGSKKSGIQSAADLSQLPFDIKDLTPETFDKIKAIIDSANAMLTDEEKKWNQEQKKKQIDTQKKFDEALERETRKEIFEIPKGSAKTYKFLGYDTDQYKEIMLLGNQADDMKDKKTKEFMDIQDNVFKKTIIYSLEGMNNEVLNKLPRRDVFWLYLVMKDKNENPLPFEVNA